MVNITDGYAAVFNKNNKDLPDLQRTPVSDPLNKVGVKGVQHSLEFFGNTQTCKISALVDLKKTRGVHMSRFIECIKHLSSAKDTQLDIFLRNVADKQHAQDGYVTVSGLYFCKDGTTVPLAVSLSTNGLQVPKKVCTFTIQLISTCPCSLELCKHVGKGVPHMQRAFLTVTCEVPLFGNVPHIIDTLRKQFVTPKLLLKRDGELQIALKCEKLPTFVEDVARIARTTLNGLSPYVLDKCIYVESEESIHQFSAVCSDGNWHLKLLMA